MESLHTCKFVFGFVRLYIEWILAAKFFRKLVLSSSQIVSRLPFFTPSLTTRLQKICANIVKFKSFLKNFY